MGVLRYDSLAHGRDFVMVTPPAAEPVSLAEATLYLRQNLTDEDDELERLVTAGRTLVEDLTGRALITQTRKLPLESFPCSPEVAIDLPGGKLQSVSSVSYVDDAGATQTWSSSDYQVDTLSEPGRLLPAYGEVYPATRAQLNAVQITYVCGYGAAASAVPGPLRDAVLLFVKHMYVEKGGELPKAFYDLIRPYRLRSA